ncbi:FecR family protein [Parapedobacter sp. 2B3]|uniref:FecR family protein n=1 Tax=Parapedobacter sp. 2B3 TaxID=3342381 RepID=UPI0035B618CE
MDENLHKAKELLRKYREDSCTPDEKAWVEKWYTQLHDGATDLTDTELADDLASLKAKLDHIPQQNPFNRTLLSIAAAILVLLSVGVLIYRYQQQKQPDHSLTSQYGGDVLPGGNRATLSFSGGNSITLNENKDGIVTTTEQYTYTDGEPVSATLKKTEYATLTTPRGGQYQITLPDGTKVWLNAASSLRYPVVFNAGERKVELTGEGYFEVTHDEQHPFIVESKDQSVQVLGTSFNINAYTDENIVTTTLVSGSVKLYQSRSDKEQLLQPGEQAVLRGEAFKVQQVDVGDYTSWKNGLIVLNDADLSTIIRQIERWYDVEFIMPETTAAYKVFGELNRDVNLSQILNALHEYYGLNFKIEGRRIIVSK